MNWYDMYDKTEFVECKKCGKLIWRRGNNELCTDCYVATHPEEFRCPKGHFTWTPWSCTQCWEESLSKRKEVR